ncbi:glycolate oxidase subunit GlcF [Acetobacter oeni]|uniref:Glycolate oxidase iron-sulfur subunit n=1 Tax=Acetobacter oeni TaxID=304077 RepID=A0A511XMQ3_9PROT|nr:glycolate oxidase subunit GlcF [Acetobacter oeni]MBB3884130.1 glycolate oxidase iron-sulfur subunit [Acetobacter oeni]NHO20132.1 glycolate oxidase subunit GlcF [Acetobacter oeni]GBR04336.1 Fe-S oxidoreductase [Acetobacter oeni LMG 21952]GEN64224.1 glycolate oxidase iron-sulfur subunit [Acetobacter oeni]
MLSHIPQKLLENPDIALSGDIIGNCVHCGICLSHCPTYTVIHNENDSPRGRIFLIRDMYEKGGAPDAKTVEHLDRCLTCLACEAICPSGVEYSKLIGHAREYVEANYTRSHWQRAVRSTLEMLLPRPELFRLSLYAGKLGRPFRSLFSGTIRAMLDMVPKNPLPAKGNINKPGLYATKETRKKRVALLTGCVQNTLDPAINDATVRLLNRHGVDVVVARGAGCCGAPAEHMGDEDKALPYVKANIDAWLREADSPEGLDAIVINASGCGTSVKAYGHALRNDPAWATKAARVSALAKDITEFMTTIGLNKPAIETGQRVVYHSACSMQHGQRITVQPKALLEEAGFEVLDVPEGYLCCGSAGTYNLLQPEIANELKARKLKNLKSVHAQIAASGNIGCITQLADEAGIPFVHTAELLDWATGGPLPPAMTERAH